MPTYDYRCAKCGDELEVFQSFAEKPAHQARRVRRQARQGALAGRASSSRARASTRPTTAARRSGPAPANPTTAARRSRARTARAPEAPSRAATRSAPIPGSPTPAKSDSEKSGFRQIRLREVGLRVVELERFRVDFEARGQVRLSHRGLPRARKRLIVCGCFSAPLPRVDLRSEGCACAVRLGSCSRGLPRSSSP